MKNLFVAAAIVLGTVAFSACDSKPAAEATDAAVEAVDSTAEAATEAIDSTAEVAIDSIKADSAK
jgi:hypothetical protein